MAACDVNTITAENAMRFASYSERHALILAMAAEERGCDCAAYRDWYTYKRWRALGYQVRRGEHGIKLTVYIPRYERGDDGEERVTGRYPKTTTVFCRHQVDMRG